MPNAYKSIHMIASRSYLSLSKYTPQANNSVNAPNPFIQDTFPACIWSWAPYAPIKTLPARSQNPPLVI